MLPKTILAIDIGSGTQDILIYAEGEPVENCVQMVLPSPTQIVAEEVSRATRAGKRIFLHGNTMGGGACSWAVEKHIDAGFEVYATELAALTFHDNLNEVRRRGIRVVKTRPRGAESIRLGDVDLSRLRQALAPFHLEIPAEAAIAVQDHGFNPHGSNRRLRFQYWENFLASGGRLQDLIYFRPPDYMTRMKAVRRDLPDAAVMDTCAAAVWGMLDDPRVAEIRHEGFVALNLGNQHTLGALVRGDRVRGIFEHHTGKLTVPKLRSIVERFPQKQVTNDEIFNDGGHGCAADRRLAGRHGFRFVAVTGPRRSLAEGLGYYMAAPYGNMMLTGCFGLVAALKAKLVTMVKQKTKDKISPQSRRERKG
jgi:uncharacterized protein (DUF1786 family)